MKVLLTGGDGFIGSRLRELYDDVEWVSYDLKRGLDILDVDTLREHAAGCEVVVHLAAMIDQVESTKKPDFYHENNVEGTRLVVQIARELGLRMVFASSSAAYDWQANPYAMSKWLAEHFVRTLPNHCVLRWFNVYGPGDRPNTVIPTFIRAARDGTPIAILGDGLQTRDFIHVRDICFQVMTHLMSGESKDGGTGIPTTINQLAAEVMAIAGRQVEVVYGPARQEIFYSVAERGITGAIGLEDGLRELWEAR